MNLAITASESEERRIWDANPHLALAHADLGAFRQAHALRHREHDRRRGDEGSMALRMWDTWRTEAEARLRLVRDPGAEPSSPLPTVERRGPRLTVWIYGPIGFNGIQAADVRETLDANRDASSIVVRIASAGGLSAEGMTIARCLMNHGARIVGVIDRFAYSAASAIAAVSDRLVIRQSATWMAHRAHKTVSGNAEDLMRAVAELNNDDLASDALYCRKRGNRSAVRRLVLEERYLSASEAVAAGVCDAVVPDLPILEHTP